MSASVRILVMFHSSHDGYFVCLKKKEGPEAYGMTYIEEFPTEISEAKARAWIHEKLLGVFERRNVVDRLMQSENTFFRVCYEEEPEHSFNFVVVADHGRIPNTISQCPSKETYPLDTVAHGARTDIGARTGSEIGMSANTFAVIEQLAWKYLPKPQESRQPLPTG